MLSLEELTHNLIQILKLYSKKEPPSAYSRKILAAPDSDLSQDVLTKIALEEIRKDQRSNKYPFAQYLLFIAEIIESKKNDLLDNSTEKAARLALENYLVCFFVNIKELLFINKPKEITYNDVTTVYPSLQSSKKWPVLTTYTRMGELVKRCLIDPNYINQKTSPQDIKSDITNMIDNFIIIQNIPSLEQKLEMQIVRANAFFEELQKVTQMSANLEEEITALREDNAHLKKTVDCLLTQLNKTIETGDIETEKLSL